MNSENNISIYIIIFIIIVLILFAIYYFYYNKKKIEPSTPITPSTLTNNDKLKISNYKKEIIKDINKKSGIIKESFYDFNNVIIADPDYVPVKCISAVNGLEEGVINDQRLVKCSKVLNLPDEYIDGNFKVKCNDSFKWEAYDFDCAIKGIDKKIDINGKWNLFRLTDDEINGTVPIDFNRELTEEEKNNPRKSVIFKNFNLDTEKGAFSIDGRDGEIVYINTIGYRITNAFPFGLKFYNNGNFNILLGPGAFLKKAE